MNNKYVTIKSYKIDGFRYVENSLQFKLNAHCLTCLLQVSSKVCNEQKIW